MATQVPFINRADPQATESFGLTQASTPDISQVSQAIGRGLTGLASDVAEVYLKVEDNAAKTKADELANRFEIERNDRLYGANGIAHKRGDVSSDYQEYSESGNQVMQEILEQNSGISEKAKILASQKMAQVRDRYEMKGNVSYGKQNNDYIKETSDSSVGLLKDDLVFSASIMKAGDETSFTMSDNAIKGIMQARYEMADRLNIPKDSVNLDIARDLSSGIKEVIGTLTSVGDVDTAEETYKRYGKFLDSRTRPDVEKSIYDRRIEVKANEISRKAETQKDPLAFINREENGEIRKKAMQVYSDTRRYQENERSRIADQTYNRETLRLDPLIRNKEITTVTELNEDPVLQRSLRLMEPEQRKKIYDSIKNVEKNESDPEVYKQALNAFASGDLGSWTGDQLVSNTVGLTNTDHNAIRTLWKEQRADPDSSRRSRFNYAEQRLYNRALNSGLIRKGKDGKLTKDSVKEWDTLQSNLFRNSNKLPKNMDEAGWEAEVDRMLTDKIKAKNQDTGSSWRNGWGLFGASNKTYTPPVKTEINNVPRRGQQLPNSPLLDQTTQSQQDVTSGLSVPPVPPTLPPPPGGGAGQTQAQKQAAYAEGIKAFKAKYPGKTPTKEGVFKLMEEENQKGN